ncbi:MAG: hypothetical protein Q8N23_31285 [Archangium sp.]|nr:hypothetical protein [Archangium sp.]MDP3157197.1 hypothetical protein [Archangium sp.]MDP3575527.1 hypothetical protein [Archangium sp.]
MISTFVLLSLGQFCPSYTLNSTNNTANCGVSAVNGTNPTTAQWQGIFQLVSQGPSVWGSAGPSVPDLGQGCGKPMPTVQVSAKFPCEVLKAIAMVESGWRQFCVPTTPSDQVGGASRTIISFDCGYGIGQVTSGMHIGEAPNFDRARVASDPTYNLATGTRILGEKWRATRCVGDNQPRVIEHWYSAVWAYNGLAYSNNPNNPNFDSARGVYRPSVGGAAPYQEKVFGWMEYPPAAGQWTSVALAYPKLSDIGTTGSPNTLPDPSCASPASCASTRSTHVSGCFQMNADAGTGGGGGTTGGGAGGGGGATGGGGGSTRPDAGAPDAGIPDAGAGDAGVEPALVTLLRAEETIGPRAGCGCDSAPGLLALISLALLRRRRGR